MSCNKKDCIFHAGRLSPWDCDYCDITGHSKLAALRAAGINKKPKPCPFYQTGQRDSFSSSGWRFDWQKARELYEQGLSDTKIADQLGCSRVKVTEWRNKNQLPPHKHRVDRAAVRRLHEQGMSVKEIAAEQKCSFQSVYKIINEKE